MSKILIAEDDPNIRIGLIDTLESEGYLVISSENGKIALDEHNKQSFDLIILDVMMPEVSGYDVCRTIRKSDEQTPIIMLTAKGEEIDKVVGLELGADDYVTKPFGIRELLARIEAVLRRSRKKHISNDSKNLIEFNFANGKVKVSHLKFIQEGKETDISQRELHLMQEFYSHKGEVMSREYLLDKVWGMQYGGTTRTLDQHILTLRKKIETDPIQHQYIQTVHGCGYRYIET